MKTKKTSELGSSNVGITRYVLRSPDGQFVASFAMSDWSFVLCTRMEDALMFGSMTQALAVGFCLGFGMNMAAIPYNPHQLQFPFKLRHHELPGLRGA
jgi:hypothetical protein